MTKQLIPLSLLEFSNTIELCLESLHPHHVVVWILIYTSTHVIAWPKAQLLEGLLHCLKKLEGELHEVGYRAHTMFLSLENRALGLSLALSWSVDGGSLLSFSYGYLETDETSWGIRILCS